MWTELENVARQVIEAAKIRNASWVMLTAVEGDYTVTIREAAQQAQAKFDTSPASTELVIILLEQDIEKALIWAAETAVGWAVKQG